MNNIIEERQFIAEKFKRLGFPAIADTVTKSLGETFREFTNLLVVLAQARKQSTIIEELEFAGLLY